MRATAASLQSSRLDAKLHSMAPWCVRFNEIRSHLTPALLSPSRVARKRAYYGSTQLLQTAAGAPYWIVNEGEYRMMNTVR